MHTAAWTAPTTATAPPRFTVRPARRRCVRSAVAAMTTGVTLLLAGCGTDRFLTIQSEPAGALVHLNDQEVGRTPLTLPFAYYGVYDVRLAREEFQPLWTTRRANAPVWEFPPLDLTSEFVGGDVGLLWRFELQPAPEVGNASTDELLDAARALRKRAESGS